MTKTSNNAIAMVSVDLSHNTKSMLKGCLRMRKLEIKEIGIKSAFKTTLYTTSLPLACMTVIGILLSLLGVLSGNHTLTFVGLPYIIMPVFLVFLYGALSMLIALVYNKLSGKFGGLEITVVDKETGENFRY